MGVLKTLPLRPKKRLNFSNRISLNLYSNKRRWKLILFLIACLIFFSSLFYSNFIVQKIAQEERNQVKLWAEALRRKSDLVKYTQELFDKLALTERKKVELWSEATQLLASPDYNGDFSFLLKVIADNTTIPIILTDDNERIISSRNIAFTDSVQKNQILESELQEMISLRNKIEIDVYQGQKNFLYYKESKLITELKSNMNDLIQSFISEIVINNASLPVILVDESTKKIISWGNISDEIVRDTSALESLIQEMKTNNKPIKIALANGRTHHVYYNNSVTYQRLKYYPIIQFFVIGLFFLVSYSLFNSYRTSEQNQVWAGMAKETAHQLGTPISSLLGWVEYLKLKNMDVDIVSEIEKDVSRLQIVADRFSKIGSTPELINQELTNIVRETVDYMQKRCSSSIVIRLDAPLELKNVVINKVLFEWVIENLIRNSIDSMETGKGQISVQLAQIEQSIVIDITDNGKGIQKNKIKEVFKPGFTTKKRGWGLGLSLSKRIIEDYHKGKIYVKQSELGNGTTFRIILNQ